jgi:hypothetical protein
LKTLTVAMLEELVGGPSRRSAGAKADGHYNNPVGRVPRSGPGSGVSETDA